MCPEELLVNLTEELETQSVDQLKTEIPAEKKLLEASLKSSVVKKVFDKEVGEEANQVNLKMELKATAFVYSEEELRQLIQQSE